MSSSLAVEQHGPRSTASVAPQWRRFIALGAVLIVVGVFALGDVVLASLVSVILIGAAMLVGGVFQLIHAAATKRNWGSFVFGLLSGLLYVIAGTFVMREPVRGSIVITLFILMCLVAGGVLRSVIALRHRELPGWWLMLVGGLLSVILGIMLYRALPWSGLWVLGLLVGVELVVQGVSWLQFGLGLRKLRT